MVSLPSHELKQYVYSVYSFFSKGFDANFTLLNIAYFLHKIEAMCTFKLGFLVKYFLQISHWNDAFNFIYSDPFILLLRF